MNITISENLRKYRKNKENTQEELAEYLGISIQAVSKWERNEGFPDITLLPRIAAYYNVSVDDLLGVGKIQQQEKVAVYQERAEKENKLEVWQEAIKEFPNNLGVICSYMYALSDDNEENINEKIMLAERLIKESTEEENYNNSAMQTLCYAYMELGDNKTARKYASEMPNYYITRNQLMMSLLQGEEAVNHIQNNIVMLIDLFYLNVINMVKSGDFSSKEKISIYEDTIKIIDLVYAGNLGRCYDWTFDLYFMIAQNYAKINDSNNALKNLDISAEHQIRWIMLPEKAINTSLFVNRHGYGNAKTTNNVKWLLDEMQGDVFDSCREDKRFEAIEKKLREYAE